MARKVKFPLKMADGFEVRTLDELKEHFDVESIVGYFSDGRLLNWLQTRYYEDEADKVEQLEADDSQLHKKLCAIFGVESAQDVDPEEIARRQERLNRLKQYTDDEKILERVDQVAFDQEDLGDLLDDDATLIYLCNNRSPSPCASPIKPTSASARLLPSFVAINLSTLTPLTSRSNAFILTTTIKKFLTCRRLPKPNRPITWKQRVSKTNINLCKKRQILGKKFFRIRMNFSF